MNGQDDVERGAAEDASDSPLTETEVRASQRPPSEGDQGAAEDEQVTGAEQGDVMDVDDDIDVDEDGSEDAEM